MEALPCEPPQDMGLAPSDVKELTAAWSVTQAAVHHKVVASGGFDWALLKCAPVPTAAQPCTIPPAVSPWVAPWYPGRNDSGPTAQGQCTVQVRAFNPEAPFNPPSRIIPGLYYWTVF